MKQTGKDNTIWIILGVILAIVVVAKLPFGGAQAIYGTTDLVSCQSQLALQRSNYPNGYTTECTLITQSILTCMESCGSISSTWIDDYMFVYDTSSTPTTLESCITACFGGGGGTSCSDTDGGNYPNTAGRVAGTSASGSYDYIDYCVSDGTPEGSITEWYCSGTSLQGGTVKCASGRQCTGSSSTTGSTAAYCKVDTDPCAGISCDNECDGTTGLYYNGQCLVDGNSHICAYDHKSCTDGCSNGQCTDWSVCTTGEISYDCATINGCTARKTCSNGQWGLCAKADSTCGSAIKCSDTTSSGGTAYFSAGEKRSCTISSCSGIKTCGNSGQWGECIKVDSSCGSTVNSTYCPYKFTAMTGGGFTVENLANQDNPRCIPENCSYIEKSGFSTTIASLMTGLPQKIVSTCCEGSVKEITGGFDIKYMGISLARQETGVCQKETGFCSWFGFLKDALPDKAKEYSCTIGIGAIAIVFLVILKGMVR